MDSGEGLGKRFADALADKDVGRLTDLLHPEIDFGALTPRRQWEATGPAAVLSTLLESWFEPSDHIESVEAVETGAVADRERVGYRFRITNPEGRFVVEQQAYLSERDGQIGWMRVVCSGFRPAG